MHSKIVVTGMGVISPAGVGITPLQYTLKEGKSCVHHIDAFPAENLPCKAGGQIRNFEVQDFMDSKEAKKLERSAQLFLAAGSMAIEDSQLFKKKVNRQQIGIFEGTSLGALNGTLKEHAAFLSDSDHKFNPQAVRTLMTGAGGSMVSLRYGLQGPIFSLSNGSASSAFAFSTAVDKLRLKDIDVAIVGGSEAPVGFEIVLLFSRARMLTIHYDQPEQACRPFDAERNGTVLGEGGAVFILERMEHALKREAKIYAEVGSVVLTSDAYSLVVPEPEAEQQARAMRLAMQKASVTSDCVDYISAHGTGTYLNDRTETLAIKKAFGEKACRIPISSSKAMLGHALGATTALEVAKTIISMENQFVPPTINLMHPDPECDLDYVPNHSRKGDIRTALVNNSSFGGKNSSIVLKRWEQ